MKTKTFLLILTLIFLLTGCKKTTVDNTVYVKTPTGLIGSWNWNKTSGGYALVKYDPISTGKSIRIELDSLNTYKYFSNDTLEYESKFRISKTVSIFNHKDSALIIIIDPNPNYTMNLSKNWIDFTFHCYFSFHSPDTLIFTDPAYDGFDHTYCRIK